MPGAPAIVFLAEGRHGPDAGEYGEKISVTLVRRCECERPRLWGPTHGRLTHQKSIVKAFAKAQTGQKQPGETSCEYLGGTRDHGCRTRA